MKTAPGANETGKVIFDEECKEYKEGWNANNSGKHFLSNPYSCLAYNGELYRLWQKGFDANYVEWNKDQGSLPTSFTQDEIDSSFTITNPKNQDNY